MALTNWNISDGTKRNLFQNPTGIPFWTWPIVPSWKVARGGQINQLLIADGTSTTVGPQFLYQGLRVYDGPVAWKPPYTYREEEYEYAVNFEFTANTVNPPAIIQTTLTQIINNFAFKLKRISVAYRPGPTNTAAAQALGCRIYDWQNRSLMSDWVNTQFLDFNARNSTGSPIYGPHASFPAVPLLYPVNGRFVIDITDMQAQFAGSVSDIQGVILLQGSNLVPCSGLDPRAVQPPASIYDNVLPYFYLNPMINIAQNKQTFTSNAVFSTAIDSDSDFWMTAVHNARSARHGPTHLIGTKYVYSIS